MSLCLILKEKGPISHAKLLRVFAEGDLCELPRRELHDILTPGCDKVSSFTHSNLLDIFLFAFFFEERIGVPGNAAGILDAVHLLHACSRRVGKTSGFDAWCGS